jgi:hypothetical protein
MESGDLRADFLSKRERRRLAVDPLRGHPPR